MSVLLLIGPRGAGKSSVGSHAAGLLGLPFSDVDDLIEQRTRLTVVEIFARRGEPAFRALERGLMLEVLGDPRPRVVATGGGCVLDSDVRTRLRQHPGVIWLDAPVAELRRRIAGGARPSLTGQDPLQELARVVGEREPLYRACSAHGVRLDTGALSLEQAALAVARRFRLLDPTSKGDA